jgi:hypothetical protein
MALLEGSLGWLLDPTKMPAPDTILCPGSTPASSPTKDELLEDKRDKKPDKQ